MNINFKWYIPRVILWLVFLVALLNKNPYIQLVAAVLVILVSLGELFYKKNRDQKNKE